MQLSFSYLAKNFKIAPIYKQFKTSSIFSNLINS